MSRSISFDVELYKNTSAKAILESLIKAGWNPIIDNAINYLPIGDNDMFDWTMEELTIDKLFEIIYLKEKMKETIGVQLNWENTDIGVTLSISNQKELYFIISINTKYIDRDVYFVDFNWYAQKFLYPIQEIGEIFKYEFSFIY